MNGLIAGLFILGFVLILVLAYFLKVLDWILIILAFCLAGAWSVVHKVPTDTVSRWGFFAFASVTLFYWVIKQSRRLWRNAFFWGTIGGLLVVHTAAFSFVAPNLFEQRPGSVFFFFILAPVEAFTITMIVDKVVRRFGRHHRLEV